MMWHIRIKKTKANYAASSVLINVIRKEDQCKNDLCFKVSGDDDWRSWGQLAYKTLYTNGEKISQSDSKHKANASLRGFYFVPVSHDL